MGFSRWKQSWRELRKRLLGGQWAELKGRERTARFVLDIARLAMLRLRRNRAGMMAAALSYRVLFSMLPLLVLAAAVARRSVSEEAFLETIRELIKRMGLQRVEIQSGTHAGEQLDLGNWLEGLAEQAAAYDVTGVTWIGIIVLVWAVYRLFDEIEASLSVIGSGVRRRKMWVRMLVSLALLVIGPALATWGLAVLDDVTGHLQASGISVLADAGRLALSLLAVWLFVTLGYRFIPAGRLSWRAAAVGGLLAAVSLMLGEWALERFVVGAMRTSPIGGSLGLVPLLMLWLYVMWMCVLYGMEVAVLLHRASRRWRGSA
ncbi:MAG: YihY/virulence factor BrkB family protein [Phycisphaerales bacterium]|jgi:YihY family inner membrane protein|nr:YihY/virulence factor BrkB family protein [Phycisphaerales bacterium]